MRLNFSNINRGNQNEESPERVGNIKSLENLESLRKTRSPMIQSSRQTTARKQELEAQTLEVVALIRNHFSTKNTCPPTNTNFYKIGRVLGKGAFGKVNLAMHILAKRLGKFSAKIFIVAIKSLNKKHMKEESAMK